MTLSECYSPDSLARESDQRHVYLYYDGRRTDKKVINDRGEA